MLDRELAEVVLHAARRRGGSFAELFVEERTGVSVRLDDGNVEELTTGLDRGAGVRVASRAPRTATRTRTASTETRSSRPRRPRRPHYPTRVRGDVVDLRRREPLVNPSTRRRPPMRADAAQKVAWLREVDDAARAYSAGGRAGDRRVRRFARSGALIATSDGRWVEEDPPARSGWWRQSSRLATASIQTGFHGPAALRRLEFLEANPPAGHRRGRRASAP